ncbi:alpha/beta hydrolase family protein [Vibrio crassostreae]|uniref:alpha/beta hydrolase family protein n=1 Tax=Vibrio crassostreae TaxID=246167 RepID=UPI00062EB24F|nr:alpha/beta hydrolase [Vibrio crassostreae]TCO00787.1 putative dienelactone hydrolase [Vibrio crassostreae]TCT49140.1 putative dienelactone hydrolase [Vibrio crassostreae]TCT73909.1 putative dienelactone hydrolase [Vibrio crassostreae]TCT74456.1 putative dienelactone hydrolase [Vibrio crassostreae]TCT94026.1 putative dienelactone hydrolase [Vibrio crassostreae]
MKYTHLLFTSLLFLCSSAIASGVGFTQVTVNDDPNRPLNTAIWYPTRDTSGVALIGDNPVFIGTQVIKYANIQPGTFPVILLSHGYRGNWRNQNWLATKLASQGYIVAATDHPGTTSFDHSPKQAAKWWERPRDVSRILDYLLSEAPWKQSASSDNVSAIGHSLGGWTVMQLAGAKMDRPTFEANCLNYPNPRTCGLAKELGLDKVQDEEPDPKDLSDPRIQRVVSLDLGLARSFSANSLKGINVPALILAAGIDIGDLPQASESGYIAEHMPLNSRRYKVYEKATHFSFIQSCKPGAIAMLNEEVPGDGIICKDGIGTSRDQLHQLILNDIISFLN